MDDEARLRREQCEKCKWLGCDRGPGFADIADDPPSRWRCRCECHPANNSTENFRKFADTVSKRAYVIAHPDTLADFRRNLPRMMAAMDKLVEATGGQYLPNKWCDAGSLYALPFKQLDFPLPKIADDFKEPFNFTERFVIVPRRFVTWAMVG